MTPVTRNILLSAAAVAALGLSAVSAGAHDAHDCADAACASELLFQAPQTGAAGGGSASLASPKYGTWGFDLAGVDPSVKPGDDFYAYANGTW